MKLFRRHSCLVGINVILLVCSFYTLHAQTPTFSKMWDKRIGGNRDDQIGNFHLLPGRDYIMGGTSMSGISGDKTENNHDTTLSASDFWVVKTDSNATVIWDHRFGGLNSDLLCEIIQTSDGGLLCGGQSYSSASGDKSEDNWDLTQQTNDYWIIKLDSNGIKEWDKRYGGTSFELFASVKEKQTGGYYISGSSISVISGDKTEANFGNWDYWVVRSNATGTVIWDRTFGGADDDFATWSEITSDGGILVGGYSNSNVSGDKSEPSRGTWDYWVIKIDSTGNKVWDKTFGGNYIEYLFYICKAANNGFLLGGQSYSQASGDKTENNHDTTAAGSDYWVVRIDGNGNKLWDRTYGAYDTEQLSRCKNTTDGGFLLSGESYSSGNGDKTEINLGEEQTWVVKTDSAGNLLWDKTIFTYGHDELGTAIDVTDSCFTAINYTYADTGGYKSQMSWGLGDYWVVKVCITDPSSIFEPGSTLESLEVYPNPAGEHLTISIPSGLNGKGKLEIFDIQGRKLAENLITHSVKSLSQWDADISQLEQGIYLVVLTSDAGIPYTARFVKQ